MKVILALIIFSLIVIIHELGHFLLAKRNGIGVTEFSIGMGPKLFHIKKGETDYCVKLLPFGGSCMMVGEDGMGEEAEVTSEISFASKTAWQRIAVVVAGPIFNFLLAFFLAFFIVGSIGYDAPVVAGTIEGYPAAEAGLQEGDLIIKLDNERIHVSREVSVFTMVNQNADSVKVEYERDGKRATVEIPKVQGEDGRYLMGMTMSGVRTKGNAWDVVKYSAYEERYWIKTTIKSIGMLFTGQLKANDLSGPVGIVDQIGETYEAAKEEGAFMVWLNMVNMAIFLSANIGVMNLLPIPGLDGGRLLFLVIEVIRGKKIPPDKEGMVHFAGLVLLMALMVFVMANDIRKLFI